MKVLNIILKIVLILMLLMPAIGSLGVFPPPTADLYNTPEAFEFIEALMKVKYVNWLMSIVFAISILLILTKRMALAAILIAPVVLNIISFHLFLDGGPFTLNAVFPIVLSLLNIYFLWQNKEEYKNLFRKSR